MSINSTQGQRPFRFFLVTSQNPMIYGASHDSILLTYDIVRELSRINKQLNKQHP
jgi:hypothetical protein